MCGPTRERALNTHAPEARARHIYISRKICVWHATGIYWLVFTRFLETSRRRILFAGNQSALRQKEASWLCVVTLVGLTKRIKPIVLPGTTLCTVSATQTHLMKRGLTTPPWRCFWLASSQQSSVESIDKFKNVVWHIMVVLLCLFRPKLWICLLINY